MTAWAITEPKRRGQILAALATGPGSVPSLMTATGMTGSAVVRTLRTLSIEGTVSTTGRPGEYAATEVER